MALGWQARGPFERRPAERGDVARYVSGGGIELRLEGVADSALPVAADVLAIAELASAEGRKRVRLMADGAEFVLDVRGWRVHEAQGRFYQDALASFGPSAREARTMRWLLRALRLPGGAHLLRAWHARRSR
jgi:hypothetical protein